jgi:hypothetical protein
MKYLSNQAANQALTIDTLKIALCAQWQVLHVRHLRGIRDDQGYANLQRLWFVVGPTLEGVRA